MSDSPIARLLEGIDKLDVDAVMALLAPDSQLLTVDGRRVEGTDAVRELVGAFLASLRSARHRITAEWHQGNVWIAEVDASYELQDWLQINDLPRAFVLRDGPDGVADVRIYGAHEQQLADHRSGEEGMQVGGRWVPPL